MSKFKCHIKLGNEAMETHEDIANALRALADKLERDQGNEGIIRDYNGNRVGEWEISR